MNSRTRTPPREELVEVALWFSAARSTESGWPLRGPDGLAGTRVVGVRAGRELRKEFVARIDPSGREGLEILGAEVLRDRPGGARCPEGMSELRLRGTEIALEIVARGRDQRLVEAGEDVEPIPRGDASDVIDEVVRGGRKAEARNVAAELLDQSVEALLRLARSRRPVRSVFARGYLVRDPPKDVDLERDTSCGSGAMPVGVQRLVDLREEGVWAPLFAAAV
jgi:hypothetical protein